MKPYILMYNNMQDDPIARAIKLGRQKILFYPAFPVSAITPNFTLDEFILMVNQDNIMNGGKDILANSTQDQNRPSKTFVVGNQHQQIPTVDWRQ